MTVRGPDERVCLITVASGDLYERYAKQLFASANRWFKPTASVDLVFLPGRSGWPDATLYRYHTIVEHADRFDHDFLFLCDADMRFEGPVGPEILAPLVATRHPGYVGVARADLPYERRSESTAFVRLDEGNLYFAGGLAGGNRERFFGLAKRIVTGIDRDAEAGIVACWHDESHLNRCLIDIPPFLALSPAYCHPDDASAYVPNWPEPYARLLVALDKPLAERNLLRRSTS